MSVSKQAVSLFQSDKCRP